MLNVFDEGLGNSDDIDYCEECALSDEAENEYEQAHGRDTDFLRDSSAKFILSMKEGLSLLQQSCCQMISGVTKLFDCTVSRLHRSIRIVCAATNEARQLLETVDGLLEDKSEVKGDCLPDIINGRISRKFWLERLNQ